MGFRYRKSIKIGPFRLNLSEKEVGVSAGIKGERVGVGPRGVKTTLSVPGTGIKYVKESRLMGSPSILKVPREIIHTTVPMQYKGTRWLVGTIIGLLMIGSNPALGVLVTIICGCRYYTISQRLKRQSVVSKVEVAEPPTNCG